MRAGASGFLLKSARPQQLVEAVRGIVAGDALLAPEITHRRLAEFLRRPPPEAAPRPGLNELTRRELEVLELIAAGLSNAEIAARLVVGETTACRRDEPGWSGAARRRPERLVHRKRELVSARAAGFGRYSELGFVPFEWGQRSVPLSLAAEIQRRLLPGSYTCEAGQFTLAAWLEPAVAI